MGADIASSHNEHVNRRCAITVIFFKPECAVGRCKVSESQAQEEARRLLHKQSTMPSRIRPVREITIAAKDDVFDELFKASTHVATIRGERAKADYAERDDRLRRSDGLTSQA
jgi:hypothetical protein